MLNDSYRSHGVRTASLEDIAAHAREWLFEAAAHLWRAEPCGETPLFPERMSIHGEKDSCPHRLFVQARHVYSYCELGRLGWRARLRIGSDGAHKLVIKNKSFSYCVNYLQPFQCARPSPDSRCARKATALQPCTSAFVT